MLKHIVMFRVKAGFNKEQKDKAVRELKTRLGALPGQIEEIVDFETGINFSTSPAAFDLVLYSSFKNEKDLETYKKHPKHQELISFLNEVKEEVAVVDYWEKEAGSRK